MTNGTIDTFSWQDALTETYQTFSQKVVDYAPQLIGAILLLAIGWLIANLLRLSTRKIVEGLDALFKKVSKNDTARIARLKRSYTQIISQAVYWVVILFFITASVNLLGWNVFTGWMDSVVGFVPGLITGLLIILAGFLISGTVRSAILSTHFNANASQIHRLAQGAQIAIISAAIIIGVEQIGLDMHFLTTFIVVIVGIVVAGACLAFALGARTMAANAIGAQYTRKNCSVGEHIIIGDFEGDILEIRQTCIILDTATGRAIVPAKLFNEQVSLLPSQETEATISKPGGLAKTKDSHE